jgi:eukaryotic-like serine/threonine-protein kinase
MSDKSSTFWSRIRIYYDSFLPAKSRRRKVINYLIIPFFILLIVFLFFDSLLMPWITRHGNEFELPSVVGYEIAGATEMLELINLKIEVTSEEYHADKPTGTVLSQYPAASTMVKSGRIIKVVTSIGQKFIPVPPLAGFSVRQAKLNIEAAEMSLGDVVWTFSDSLPERVVVFSYPASGSEIPIGSPVNLMVNRGSLSGIVFMPRLVGRSLEEAVTILDDIGLKVGLISEVRDENYLPQTVLEQSVEVATELEVGEEIDLMVSTTE